MLHESSSDSSPSDSDPTLLPIHSPIILNSAAHTGDSSVDEVDEPDLPTFVSNISFPPLSLTSSTSTSPPPEPVNLSNPSNLNLPKSILSLSNFPPSQLHANHTTKTPNRLPLQNTFSSATIFPSIHTLQQSSIPIGINKPTQPQTSQLTFPSQAPMQSQPQLQQQQLHTLIPSLQTSQPMLHPGAGHSMLSSAPVSSYGTITTQPHMLGSASILNQTFTSQSHQQQPQRQPVHQQLLTQPQQHSNQINTDLSAGASRLPPSIPSIPALNVPFTPSSSTVTTQSAITNSGNFSLFPTMQGVYPYTPFVGIPTVPAQMNTHFAPGIQMPTAANRSNTMPGYSYLPGMSPSLYNTQVTTNSFTRN